MKRYLLFAGHAFYPKGGWLDFIGDFETHEEAAEEANARFNSDDKKTDWYHVVDIKTGLRIIVNPGD